MPCAYMTLLYRKNKVNSMYFAVFTYILILNESFENKICSELKTTEYELKIYHIFV